MSRNVTSQQEPMTGFVPWISEQQREFRIRRVFGLGRTDYLPRVGEETLRQYYRYLRDQLSLPFRAWSHEGPGSQDGAGPAFLVYRLLDPAEHPADPISGLMCVVRSGGSESIMALLDLKVEDASHNHRLIDDYWYWFWNWQ